jgi:hypothetical protein
LAGSLLLSGVSTVRAQMAVVTVNGGEACASCSIAITPLAVIGSTDGAGALATDRPLLARDNRGRVYVFGAATEGAQVFDSTGAFIRQIGRDGSGPGEYRGVSGIQPLGGDSLAVFDGTLRRITILAPDYSLVRTMPISVSVGNPAVSRRSGRQVVANAPDLRRGDPMFVFDVATGKELRAFGSVDGTPLAQLPEGSLRSVAPDTGSATWISYATRYVLERWSLDGKKTVALTRQVPWFPETRVPNAFETGQPQPAIGSVDVDARGRLWVMSSVPDARWQSVVESVPGRRFPKITDPLRHTDSILEVIDPRSGVVLVSQRFDQPYLSLMSGQLLAEMATDSEDRPIIKLSRLELRER